MSSKSRMIASFLGGAAIGALLGYFIGSKKGRETLTKLADRTRNLTDRYFTDPEQPEMDPEATKPGDQPNP